MATADLLTHTDPERRLTRAQWARWENVGLEPSLDLEHLVLNWADSKVADLEAKGALVSLQMERTMSGASTVTMVLRDPKGRLFSQRARRMREKVDPTTAKLRQAFKREPTAVDEGWDPLLPPDVLGRAMEVSLDGVVFRLVGVAYDSATQEATLTFEDRLIYWLKRKRGPKRASRATITRAQFILSLLREVRAVQYRYVCPQLTVVQPRTKTQSAPVGREAVRAAASDPDRGSSTTVDTTSQSGGLAAKARVTVKGKSATPEQRRIGERVLRSADSEGAKGKARKALMSAVIVEAEVTNPPGGDRTSKGCLQLLSSTASGLGVDPMDVEAVCRLFLRDGFAKYSPRGAIELAKTHPEWSAGQIAQACQGSAYPKRYDEVSEDADSWLEAWSGTASSDPGGNWSTKSYQFTRNDGESSWEAMQRLAGEVSWPLFVVGRSLYFMSEPELYARRPRYQVSPDDPAVLQIRYDVDWGKAVSEATLTVALDRWGAPPGAVVVIDGYGPPDGRWLVASVSRDWFSPTAEVTLKQPGKASLEPASERSQRASNATGGEQVDQDSGSKAERVYSAARAISEKGYPYVWGGGHGAAGTPSGGTGRDSGTGYDCSGSVIAALAAAGLGYQQGGKVDVSGTMASSWGQPGRGRQFTVWANGQHVWMQFHGIGSAWRFDTSPYGSGERGPRLRSTPRPTSGFTARHWPGV